MRADAPLIRRLAALVALLLCASPLAGQRAPAHARRTGTPLSPALAQATFDTAWSVVNATLWDTAVANGTWARVRQELRPRALQARSVEEMREILGEAVHRLGYSHFGGIPGDVQERLAGGAAGADAGTGRGGRVGGGGRVG